MHIVNMENNSDEGGISDKLVFGVTVLLLFGILFALPLFESFAQTNQNTEEPLVIEDIANRDYSVLLSSLFGRVGQEVPESAYTYVQNVDEYRFRIARSIRENERLLAALHTKVDGLPKKLAEGYREEINDIRERNVNLKIAILPYIENDTFLSKAVIEHYNLYTSFVERLLDRINTGLSFENLNNTRKESYEIRRDTALLYRKINDVVNG